MGFLSIITLGLAGRKPDQLLWERQAVTYEGVSAEWMGHRYTAHLARGVETREVHYHFHTHKPVARVERLVRLDLLKLNAPT